MLFASAKDLERTERLLSGFISAYSRTEKVAKPEEPKLDTAAPLKQLFSFAGMGQAEVRTFLLKLGLAGFIIVFLSLVLQKPILILGIFPLLGLSYMLLRGLGFKRAEHFEKDYTAFLLSLASGVRTGLDPIVALTSSDKLFPSTSELGKELLKLKSSIEQGLSEEECIRRFASTINHPDTQLFRTAFILARKEGSSLSSCLQRLARVTRQRQSFRRKIRSAVAMQKLSAFGIAACTVVIGLIQFSANPQALSDAFAHPIGSKVMILGISLVCAGLFWMLNLAKSRI